MARRFARLRPGSDLPSPGYEGVPSDGLCLNVFLVFRPANAPGTVLLGQIDPSGPWNDLAALTPDRVERLADQWLLPASQLLLLESPDAAAARIAHEQLEMELAELPAPRVFSETYERPGAKGKDPHWDLQFVYDLVWPDERAPHASAWKELALVDVARTPRAQFGRGHADVLELVGVMAA
jgi:hypothetical protein